ncbi:MAG: disulfide bond formation protein DsbA [Euzebya sp.]
MWITSHWLHDEVAPHRDIQIDYRPISLMVRNEGKNLSEDYQKATPAMQRSFGLLRIIEALRADGKADLVHDVYVAFGRHFHHDDDGLKFDIADALTKAGVDASYAESYDDTSFDAAVRASTREAEDVAGDDVGTPIIAYEVTGEDGSTQWKGYFGPVIPKVVTGQAALQLWDGLSALIQTDGFYELKRTRSVGPDMDSVTLP